MRIMINQAEIEEAIEKLVLEQVRVPDDMRIDIDLKATRGEEGYQAIIDIVPHDAPSDGTDRSVDPRVEPVKGSETLGIAEKVTAAKAQADQPRRRGRPPGAKNKSKTDEPNAETVQAMTDARQGNTEKTGTVEATMASLNAPEPVSEPVEEVVEEITEVTEPETEQVEEIQPVEEVVEEVAPEAPAPTVTEADVTTQASEELVESVSEAEPEPVVEAEPTPAPAPVKSLFANLKKPVNPPKAS